MALQVIEVDGSPSPFIWKLILPNGTLTDNNNATGTIDLTTILASKPDLATITYFGAI